MIRNSATTKMFASWHLCMWRVTYKCARIIRIRTHTHAHTHTTALHLLKYLFVSSIPLSFSSKWLFSSFQFIFAYNSTILKIIIKTLLTENTHYVYNPHWRLTQCCPSFTREQTNVPITAFNLRTKDVKTLVAYPTWVRVSYVEFQIRTPPLEQPSATLFVTFGINRSKRLVVQRRRSVC